MKGGCFLSPKDERDYPICMAYDDSEDIEIPESFELPWKPPYEKQVAGNCVAQTLANILEVLWHGITGEHEDFSIGFIYGNRKDGQSKSEGMTGYMACENLCNDGDVKASVFENPGEVPSIITRVEKFKANHPSWEEEAYKTSSYIRTNSKGAVKRFILKHGIPIMAVCKVSKFWAGEGYHAMALCGWKGDVAIMQNSWGKNHAAKIVELSFDDIEEFWLISPFEVCNFSDLTREHWAYSDIEKCVAKGVMKGYPDGTIRPNGNITRAELCAMLYRDERCKNG